MFVIRSGLIGGGVGGRFGRLIPAGPGVGFYGPGSISQIMCRDQLNCHQQFDAEQAKLVRNATDALASLMLAGDQSSGGLS